MRGRMTASAEQPLSTAMLLQRGSSLLPPVAWYAGWGITIFLKLAYKGKGKGKGVYLI